MDPLNKFLHDHPGKVTKSDAVYSALAKWKYLGEIDFSDIYFKIKFRDATDRDKEKVGYLCIRTAYGTLCFARATIGLLGRDVYQDKLTDRLFGDLVLAGSVMKIADNVYFGPDSLADLQQLFNTILQRCCTSDLWLKASKVRPNVQQADILGLCLSRGKLSPSRHKLDPLADTEPPKTVSALRSWLGAVCFNEICLPGFWGIS